MTQARTLRPVTIQGNTDTSFLKLLALIFMITDHVGATLFPQIFELRLIGRIAFPLYAWCLVVGSEYTRDAWRYAMRIALIGLLSQPFFMGALHHGWPEFQAFLLQGNLLAAFGVFFSQPNIFLTLLLGLLGIIAIQKKWYFSHIWGPVLAVAMGAILGPDYGWKGVLFVLVLYAARKSRGGLFGAFIAYCLFWGAGGTANTIFFGWQLPLPRNGNLSSIIKAFLQTQTMAWMAAPLMIFPTKTHWKLPKWLGYSAYPLHLALLWLVEVLIAL